MGEGGEAIAARIAIALVLAGVFTGAFLLGEIVWGGVTLLVLLVAAGEWARLGGLAFRQAVAYAAAVAVLSGIALALLRGGQIGGGDLYSAGMLFWLGVAPLMLIGLCVRSEMLHAMMGALVLLCAWTATMDLYGTNPKLLLFTVVLVALYDSAAMFAGRKYGKRRLAQRISPNKTWEGVAGGVLVAHLAAFALWGMLGRGFPLVAVMCFTLGLLMMSILGDLFESTLKRAADVSDSGRALRSHGGVLDRVDGMLPVIPLVALVNHSFELPG